MHKIDRACAETIFGPMRERGPTKPGTCPVCREPVEAYYRDPTIRGLVQQILPRPAEIIPEVSAAREPEEQLPFPGKGAKFVLSQQNWEYHQERNIVRQLQFTSVTVDSLFSELIVNGYREGSISITILLRRSEDAPAVCRYFSSHELLLDGYHTRTLLNARFYDLYSTTPQQLKTLFRIIAENNELPAEHYPLIRALVESGDWRTVTPLLHAIPAEEKEPSEP